MLLLSHLLIGAVLLTPLGASNIPPMNAGIGVLVVLSAVASAMGNLLLIIANRMADASRLAPLVYVQLVSATALGYLVFGDLPDRLSLLGLVLLVASGFLSFVVMQDRRKVAKTCSADGQGA
jgi:drug/metabolite transporter (DMT)-like permease